MTPSTSIDIGNGVDRALDWAERHDNREAFAETLCALAREDDRVVAVSNDSVGSSKLGRFAEEFPDRLMNVGIAEQNMVGAGAGLAARGLIPFVCSAAPFLTGRALEQIKADVAYSRHNVILCGMSPGMAYGELGPTHHSTEDLSWVRALPGLDIVIPADRRQTAQALTQAVANPRPTYMRIGRFAVPDVTVDGDTLDRGRFNRHRDGTAATIIATGSLVAESLVAADRLAADGIDVRILNAAYIAPLDVDAIEAAAEETGAIVVAEEAMSSGGLGAAVGSVLVQRRGQHGPVRLLGISEFAPTGSNQALLEHFGLTASSIETAVRDLIP